MDLMQRCLGSQFDPLTHEAANMEAGIVHSLSKLWTHTVCFVVNEWMKMRLFVPSKTVAFPSPERSTGTGMHPQCYAQGWMLDEVVFSMVLLRVPLACGKGSLSRV